MLDSGAMPMRLLVQQVARAKGFRNAKDLGDTAGIPNVSMYRIWNGTATRIDLATLEKLCEVLQVQPGLLIMHIPKVENPPPDLSRGGPDERPGRSAGSEKRRASRKAR